MFCRPERRNHLASTVGGSRRMAGLAEASSGGFFQLVSQFATKRSHPSRLTPLGDRPNPLCSASYTIKHAGTGSPLPPLHRSCETTRLSLSLSLPRSVSPSLVLSPPPDRSVNGEVFYLEYRRKDPLDRARNLAVRGRTCRRCSHRSRPGIDHHF